MSRDNELAITPFVEAGIVLAADARIAAALCRLGGESKPELLLAAALAARAPRHGHVCVDLGRVAEELAAEPGELDAALNGPVGEAPEAARIELLWPALDAWLCRLRQSAIAREPADEHVAPLVLDQSRLYLDRYWRYEQRLAAELDRRARQRRTDVDPDALAQGLAALFAERNLASSSPSPDRQMLGAAMAVLRGLAIITGGPGTGKTTTVKKIVALLLAQASADSAALRRARPGRARQRGSSFRVALAAPTGKAAARLQESIREDLDKLPVSDEIRQVLAALPSFTLHRLLGARGAGSTRFRYCAQRPLPYDLVVVDEASMVSLAMMAKLVEAVPASARLVLLGDGDQLASVEAGAVLGDICHRAGRRLRLSRSFASELEAVTGCEIGRHADLLANEGIADSTIELDRPFRFGPESGIGAMARAIQRAEKGAEPVLALLRGQRTERPDGAPYDDIELCAPSRNGELGDELRETIAVGYEPFVRAALGRGDPQAALEALGRIRVLCAHRRGLLGAEVLNRQIEKWLGERVPGFEPAEPFYPGRPLLVCHNDHGLGLYNGDVGVVVADPQKPAASRRRLAAFPAPGGGLRLLSPLRLPPCETVFATSIHKSQGSQFDHAVVVLPMRRSPILSRELVYTAVTRARERVTVVADPAVLRDAVGRRIQRSSGLRHKLWGAQNSG